VTIEDGSNDDKVSTRLAYLINAKLDGTEILNNELDVTKDILNIWKYAESCMLTFDGSSKLSIHVTREMS
jgi:hypothetical protein